MSNKLLIIVSIFASLIVQGCNAVISQTSNTEIKSETTQSQKDENSKQQKVEFKGVSFTYNPQVFGEAKSEEVEEIPLENEMDKADSVAPRHLLFKIKKLAHNRESEIYVFPIEDYRRMYTVSSSLTKAFDDELNGLQKITKNENYREENQIPFIPTWDGSQTFQKKVKLISFENGKGVFFLTQFDIEPSLINNQGLTYCFQGISNDGKKYILAEFPTNVSFLPESYHVDEFENYKLPQQFYGDNAGKFNEKKHDEYIFKIAKRLDDLKSNEFEPNLNQIEEIISSLKIER